MKHTDQPKKRIAALTLGCKVNAYDTEAMLGVFAEHGYESVAFEEIADVYLVNTCTVTSFGDKKSRQMLRRARRRNPQAVVVAAGCYAQVSAERVSALPEVDLVAGTKDRMKIVELVEEYIRAANASAEKPAAFVTDIMTERVFEPLTVRRLSGHTRAYLKIQDGCDQYCSYCVIPYARGHIRSRQEAEVLEEVRALAQSGYKEVVLAGIHVASYGADLGTTDLQTVLSRVHAVDGIERIRLSSVEPGLMTPAFVSAASAMPKLCPHFHLSLQSGCDRTLARMNRRYTTEQYAAAVERLRAALSANDPLSVNGSHPEVAITTDVIVGFPGETDADFVESLAFVRAVGFARVHVFPYSPKEKTPAAGYSDQVPAETKSLRAKRMLALGEELSQTFAERQIGRELEVLYETAVGPGVYEGYSENYLTVRTEFDSELVNTIRRVRVVACENGVLLTAPENKFANF